MIFKKFDRGIVTLCLAIYLFSVRSECMAQSSLTVTSKSFVANGQIPSKYGYTQGNVSPQLSWTAGPSGTKSYAIICSDPDAPTQEHWVHVVAFNIPATIQSLSEGALNRVNSNVQLGTNDYKQVGWGGPNPPSGTHHYHFDVYALDVDFSKLSEKTTKAELLKAMKGHILAQGNLVGTYSKS